MPVIKPKFNLAEKCAWVGYPRPKVLCISLNSSFSHYPYLGVCLVSLFAAQSGLLDLCALTPRLLSFCFLPPNTAGLDTLHQTTFNSSGHCCEPLVTISSFLASSNALENSQVGMEWTGAWQGKRNGKGTQGWIIHQLANPSLNNS